MPANVSVIKLSIVPARTAFKPNEAKSDRRLGARAPIPPISMAIDTKFTNPQSAKVAIVLDLGNSEASLIYVASSL